MTAAAAAETRTSHRVTRVRVAPAPAARSLSCQVRDTEHHSYDCKIKFKEGSTPPWGPIYPLSETELQALRESLKEMEENGKIQRSTLAAGSPILFVPKPNRKGLRLCVDYRRLNKTTVPNCYPLPLMQELQDQVQGAQWFTKWT